MNIKTGFTRFKTQPQTQPEAERNPLQCVAHGCPLIGTVSLGSTGRYTCHCHTWVEADQWPSISHGIRNHDWLVSLIVQIRRTVKTAEWHELAIRFWSGQDEHMLPTESEKQRKEHYLLRLTHELEYRVGARKRRPVPLEPKPLTVRGVAVGAFTKAH